MAPTASRVTANVISARQLVQYLAASGTWDEPFDPPRFALALRDLIAAALEAGDDELVDSLQIYAASAGVCREPDLRGKLTAPAPEGGGMPLLHLAAVLQAYGGLQRAELIQPLQRAMAGRDMAAIAARLALASLALCNLDLFTRFMRAAELLERAIDATPGGTATAAQAQWTAESVAVAELTGDELAISVA